MRKIKLTKDDIKSMNPEDRDYYSTLAKTRKRQQRVSRVKRVTKGAIVAGAAAVVFKIGQNSQTTES